MVAMKNIYRLLAVLPFFAVSCVENLESGVNPEDEVNKVTITLHSGATKTMLVDDQYVVWEEGDYVWINDYYFEVALDANDPFVAYVYDVPEAEMYVAYYVEGYADYDNDCFIMNIPEVQIYREGSFDTLSNTMLAVSETTDLYFYNMTSVLKLGVKGDNVTLKSVSVAGNNDEPMGGWYTLPFDAAADFQSIEALEPAENYWQARSTEVLPNGEEGIQLSGTPQYIYVVIPPQTYEKGITVTLSDSEGRVCVQSTSKQIVAKRSEINQMADFEFKVAESISISDVTPDITFISYTVTAQPNSSIRTLLIGKDAWDIYAAGYYAEQEDDLAADVLDAYGTTVQVGDDGTYLNYVNKAWNYRGNYSRISADTDYKLLTAYADGTASRGTVLVADVRTLEATGEAPEIAATVSDIYWDSAWMTIKASEDVVSVSTYCFEDYHYESLVAEGYTDLEMMNLYCNELGYVAVEDAKTADGYVMLQTDLFQNTGYVFFVKVINATGMTALHKVDFVTASYMDPNSVWFALPSGASFDCGFLYIFGLENVFMEDITVEKMEGEDFFRIVGLTERLNAFLIESGATSENFWDVPAEGDYFYIDARNFYEVKVDSFANIMYVDGARASFYSAANVYGGSFGYLYNSENMIWLGDIVYQHIDNQIYWANDSYLYLPDMSTGGGLENEDFDNTGGEVEW